jgi:hypothetical protein
MKLLNKIWIKDENELKSMFNYWIFNLIYLRLGNCSNSYQLKILDILEVIV